MPIRRSPNDARHPVHRVVAITRNRWSRSIGITGRNQSERLVAITRCAHHAVLGLDVADHGLDGSAAAHLAADGAGDAADLACDPDLEAVGVIVAAVAPVDVDAAHRDAGERLQLGDDGTERVAVIGITVQRSDCSP